MQSTLYPKGPDYVPAQLTNPGKSFKKQVWIALGALVLFMAIYIGLSSWFLYKSFTLFVNVFSGGRDEFWSIIAALFLGFLGIFMVKALFFRTRKNNEHAIEIKPEDEPALFDFVNKIADEAKAPRPHKIFISNVVNASVSYDISIINLIFPTKKNLEIGLGLVNTLNLGEFKSIVAHEFGHFAQKSMLIGRWVYITHRVAEQIVEKRDAFDSFLNGLSGVDIRIAWIGWILSAFVWSIRSISHTLFTLVLFTQRALSREMEFQADLVAVSLTGSDAIVNSLYKLQAADEAYYNALEFVNKQLQNNKAVSNIYAIQSNSIKHMAVILNNPLYGSSPKPDETNGNAAAFRVFKEQIALAPKMWSTHPSNTDREKNAKAVYIRSETDERSPWLLFNNPDAIKNRTTLVLYRNLTIQTTPLSDEEGIALHDLEFQRSFLLPEYRGIYLARPLLLNYKSVQDIYNQKIDEGQLPLQFSLLYPDSLQQQVSTLKNLEEEIALLEGIYNKTLHAHQGKINYRNSEINRKDLPKAIEQTKQEAKSEQDKIDGHNHLCRNVHHAAAQKMGKGWSEYLVSVARLVHYCEHTRKNIEVQTKRFYETLNVALKTKNIGESDIAHLLWVSNTLHSTIEPVFTKAVEIPLSQSIIDKMDGKKLENYLEPFKLGTASRENINSWVGVVGSWVELAMKGLTVLHEAALDELLCTEEYIRTSYASPASVKEAPEPIATDHDYKKYNPGENQTFTQKPDLFSRIYHGDGIGHTIGRLGIAATIIFFAIFISLGIGKNELVIYNGLPIDVTVNIDGRKISVPHESSYETGIDNSRSLEIQTTTTTGEPIESFTAEMPNSSRNYVYNVAYAGVMYTWTAVYGSSAFDDPSDNFSLLGNPRWSEINADYYFKEPPASISLKSGTTETKNVVSAFTGHPTEAAGAIAADEDRARYIRAHATYQKSDSPHILSWMGLAALLPDLPEIVKLRLANDSLEIVSLRAEQDFYTGEEKKKICEKHKQLSLSHPGNANLYYLQCRCMENKAGQDSALIAGRKKWKDNVWIAFAAGHTFVQKEQWHEAVACFNQINEKAPFLQEGTLEEQKRVCHFIRQDSLVPYSHEAKIPYIEYLHSVESSEEDYNENMNYYYAYKLLEQGKIEQAVEYCKSDTGLQAVILRLAAVSDGADQQIINRALALRVDQGFGKSTFVPALAFQIKQNLPVEVYKEPLKEILGDEADTLFAFIRLVKTDKIAEADNLLNPLSAEMKGKFSLLGALILEEKTPLRWNSFAAGLLFMTEKPYLKYFAKNGMKSSTFYY